ncbi:hypothetical protein RRG08_047545 [Elysia crispata]|uniref:Uncharacterized protein n=1 Tax=Elysia crispata TaxID=231223 RepID=A0AAE0YPX6_9GAST|nr:hypothetical protein RRG08_047545 [Elysia crispata]
MHTLYKLTDCVLNCEAMGVLTRLELYIVH